MSPVNGVAATPPKTTTRRAASKPVVPVLPLTYAQRPASKQGPAPAATSALAGDQAEGKPVDENSGLCLPQRQSPPVEDSTEFGPGSANGVDASVSTIKPTIKAEPPRSVATPDELAKDTSTASSALLDRRMPSPASHQGPAPSNPAPEPRSSGPVLKAPITAPPATIMNRPTFHQPHPSNGSLIFGGYHDSNTSSPAPHSAGGGFPPPGMLPFPAVAPAADGYNRALLDGYPPNLISHHGPPTPHSFHGSQSSAQAEEHGFNRYPALNGHNGYPADPAGHAPMPLPGMNPPMNGTLHAAASSVSAYQTLRDQDEALAFLRHSFPDNVFNDCILDVHFSDSPEFQDHPRYRDLHRALTIPAHRFILSRSPMLAGLMKTQRVMAGGAIVLDVHDEYVRSDVFFYSLRALYGWSMANGILPTNLHLRDARDDLKTALSYISTAQYLRLGWVHAVAVQHASRLLLWETIELAVKYVCRIVSPSSRNDGFTVSELLDQVISFIVHSFPIDFVLDVTVGDFGIPRLPPASPPARGQNAPTIAHGTSSGVHNRQPSKTQAQMPRHPRVSSNYRLSQIKFGDISPSKNGQSPRVSTPNDTILSRILLNLPFDLLKQILEHPQLAKMSGELSPSSREVMIKDIIAEREARRLRALEKADPQLRVYQERVENASAPLAVGGMEDLWVNNMGFKEEVFTGDLPYIVHTWMQGSSASVGA
ncbi:BTB domain-containing protein [Madurella fahalii]|uniref:BTB domain-containing protein n=1 Tax=Madurella fahalii TaxID=1157608 RepID=A0ABQ0GEG4_9PEZI